MKKILVIGATSAIAEATARIWAKNGSRLYLLGRNEERLKTIAADLRIRGAAQVQYAQFDVNIFSLHAATLEAAALELCGIDIVLIAHGTLSDQEECSRDPKEMLLEFNTNALSVLSLLTLIANRFEIQGHGTIAVIGSVAGDRGRQSNYVYGAAKGAVTIFMQGLRQRLHKSGVQVLTIKPGFVDTPMTANFKKGRLWVKPESIAKVILQSIEQRRNVIYAPGWWWFIMSIIKCIPEFIFVRMKL